jgi:hypothetical protein
VTAIFQRNIFQNDIFQVGPANAPVWLWGEPEKQPEEVVPAEARPDPRAVVRPRPRKPLFDEAAIRALARSAYSPTDVRTSVALLMRRSREDDEEALVLLM